MALEHVLWIGGGCGSGKSTLARRLAYRFDLQLYPVDAYTFAHSRRATPAAQPLMARLAGLDFKALHVDPTVEQRVDHFTGTSAERFDMIVEDLVALADGPLVLAEGPFLLPELVAPALTDPRRAVWLLPTPDFAAKNLGKRLDLKPTKNEFDRERASRMRLERDAVLTAAMRQDAARLGLHAAELDGSLSLDDTERLLAEHFAPIVERGPRARDGAQRARMRRAENAVVNAQLDAHWESLGESAPAQRPEFSYACECATLGCDALAPMTPPAYKAAGGALGHD
ncbi:MAG: hypothetical protein ACRDXX_13925 [Stackebrandtia sp.]